MRKEALVAEKRSEKYVSTNKSDTFDATVRNRYARLRSTLQCTDEGREKAGKAQKANTCTHRVGQKDLGLPLLAIRSDWSKVKFDLRKKEGGGQEVSRSCRVSGKTMAASNGGMTTTTDSTPNILQVETILGATGSNSLVNDLLPI